ncbi:MAG: fluoride efflux transporter CrcB [Deltaproteobacteria bacterium]|nr:MAG: fluoride efflux transporter CrcB [Deltaproteobacteria bacterium]
MLRTFLVALGGLLGSVARFWLSGAVQRLNGGDFPVGTLAVNLLGGFVIGLVMALSLERGALDASVRLFLTVGFCGGFTTMSTFSYETLALLRDGQTSFALGNIAASVGGSLAATWLGYVLERTL